MGMMIHRWVHRVVEGVCRTIDDMMGHETETYIEMKGGPLDSKCTFSPTVQL